MANERRPSSRGDRGSDPAWISARSRSGTSRNTRRARDRRHPSGSYAADVGFRPSRPRRRSWQRVTRLAEPGREVDSSHLPPSTRRAPTCACLPLPQPRSSLASRRETGQRPRHNWGFRLAVRVERGLRPAAIPVAGVHGGYPSALADGSPLDHSRCLQGLAHRNGAGRRTRSTRLVAHVGLQPPTIASSASRGSLPRR